MSDPAAARILDGLTAAQIAGVTLEAAPSWEVAAEIDKRLARHGSGYADFAVLVRANNDADPFRRDLRSRCLEPRVRAP